ncbi:MAG: hypothetical protein ABW298_16860 [Candidatus Binatia bacterium]
MADGCGHGAGRGGEFGHSAGWQGHDVPGELEREKIHRNYNGWIANVIRDTQAYLEGRQPEGGLNQ